MRRAIAKIVALANDEEQYCAQLPVCDHQWNLQQRLAEPFQGRVADVVLYLDLYRICMTYM